ncbi:MAG: hypothetical protein EOO17_04335 [Chloroflexi bacterium]|nr:MAG: hypothetical protein EOO17_04335 [Chloroflexota bacterium]
MQLLFKPHIAKDRVIKREFIFAHTTITLLSLSFSVFIELFKQLSVYSGNDLILLLNIMMGLLLLTAVTSIAIIIRVIAYKK